MGYSTKAKRFLYDMFLCIVSIKVYKFNFFLIYLYILIMTDPYIRKKYTNQNVSNL